jgi:hypothetical protein
MDSGKRSRFEDACLKEDARRENRTPHNDEDLAANRGATMRIFIFKSEANPNLGAFTGDLAGLQLPSQFKPWRVIGAIAPDGDPPYKLARDVIEVAITARGFQLFRLGKKG